MSRENKLWFKEPPVKKNYYFLDTENITISGLVDSLSVVDVRPGNCLILCFNRKVVYDVVNMSELKSKFDEVIIDEVFWTGQNALDFHIMTRISILSGQNKAASIWIISKDKGYLPGIELLRMTYPNIEYKLGPQNLSDSENMFKNVLKQKVSSSHLIKGVEANKLIGEIFKIYQNTLQTEEFTKLRVETNLKFGLPEVFLIDLDSQHQLLKKYATDPYL